MKVVISIDPLKGSLTSMEAANAIKAGILSVDKSSEINILPLADGGEGTVDALVEGMKGEARRVTVSGPMNETVNAKYGILKETNTAILEMAESSGFALVPVGCGNPMKTTTYGVGEMIKEAIDKGCRNFAEVVKKYLGKDVAHVEGVGAAGGLGFGFLAFLNSKLESGIKIILEEIKLEEAVKDTDIVITGEGRLDNQTAMGKAPIGVAKSAKKYGAKVIGIAGATTDDAVICNEEGIDAYFSIVNRAMSLEDAINKENAMKNMTATTTQIFRLINAIQK